MRVPTIGLKLQEAMFIAAIQSSRVYLAPIVTLKILKIFSLRFLKMEAVLTM